MADRRLWLIDAGYLMRAQASVKPGYNFDYLKLRNWLESMGGELWRAYYLNSVPNPPSESQINFHNWLRSAPPTGPKIITKLYELKRGWVGELYCEECGKKVSPECPFHGERTLMREEQKGVDVGLATLILTHMDMYDTLVLSAGDGDLLDAVEYITEKGKRFELLVFNSGVSTEIQSRADAIHWINDFAREVAKD